jgi:hypothetical protein
MVALLLLEDEAWGSSVDWRAHQTEKETAFQIVLDEDRESKTTPTSLYTGHT